MNITDRQLDYLAYLLHEWRKYISPLLTQITEERDGKEVNATYLYFDYWLRKQSQKTASQIIQNMEAGDWTALRSTLTDAGYYTYARQIYIQINGVVDETDLAYI